MTESEITEAVRRGDLEAERQFYLENKAQCIQYALKNFFGKSKGETFKCTLEDAEEIYNDASVLFIQNIRRGRINKLEVKISTYLITSMRYMWMNKVRAHKPVPTSSKSVEDIPESDKEAMRQKVRSVINKLDPKCREMMTYRYILGWEDYEDIATITGKNNGNVVRNLISRCRKRFRDLYISAPDFSKPDKTTGYEFK